MNTSEKRKRQDVKQTSTCAV